jgi:putative ABC transport system substrate-binding protein
MNRREFIAGLGGAAAWPLAAHAQQRGRIRHVGMLLPTVSDNMAYQAWVGAFLQGMAQSGRNIGRNV